MRFFVTIPALGELREAVLARWLVAEGAVVEADQPIAVLESDKATVELPAPAPGCLIACLVTEGSKVHAGDVVGEIDPTVASATRDSVPSLFTAFAAPRRASVGESWQVRLVSLPGDVDEIDVEPGWEPIGVDGGRLVLRRRR